MPRKDVYHEIVKRALIRDGWTITHDPYPLQFGEEALYVELGADMPIGAEREGRKIAIEIMSFLGPSPVTELERAVGQFTVYRFLIERQEAERELFVAVTDVVYDAVFDSADARDLVASLRMGLLLFDAEMERIVRWIE